MADVFALRQRGGSFHVDCNASGFRLRGSLGTRSRDAALRLAHRLELAAAEGPDSPLWGELRTALPLKTFQRFADYNRHRPGAEPNWYVLAHDFRSHLAHRMALGKFSPATLPRYELVLDRFTEFLAAQVPPIVRLTDITKPLVEQFKAQRLAAIKTKKSFRGGGAIALESAILHRVFEFAAENDWLEKNPVRFEGAPGANPVRGAQPFTAEEIAKLRQHLKPHDTLTFLLLRWTGLRRTDAAKVPRSAFDLSLREMQWTAQKNKRRVIVPLSAELTEAIGSLPLQDGPLLRSDCGQPLKHYELYHLISALGERAGVAPCHPHRFRDTLAVDLLARGAQVYDVAKILGDTIQTIERHYSPFIKELRDKVRGLLDSELGLERGLERAASAGL